MTKNTEILSDQTVCRSLGCASVTLARSPPFFHLSKRWQTNFNKAFPTIFGIISICWFHFYFVTVFFFLYPLFYSLLINIAQRSTRNVIRNNRDRFFFVVFHVNENY
jgi:hypothetical protein